MVAMYLRGRSEAKGIIRSVGAVSGMVGIPEGGAGRSERSRRTSGEVGVVGKGGRTYVCGCVDSRVVDVASERPRTNLFFFLLSPSLCLCRLPSEARDGR
jgi:hypothetical protein